jgi:hypothetical protein
MENYFHQLMKDMVSTKLASEGYELHMEPSDPPIEGLTWESYRPDILGVMSSNIGLKIVLAECETNPCSSRLKTKDSKVGRIAFQRCLNQRNEFRLVLAIPFGKLSRVNHRQIRRRWEIWLINQEGQITYTIATRRAN